MLASIYKLIISWDGAVDGNVSLATGLMKLRVIVVVVDAVLIGDISLFASKSDEFLEPRIFESTGAVKWPLSAYAEKLLFFQKMSLTPDVRP